MATHTLKTHDIYWDAIRDRKKHFEVRKNDRAFQSGDTVILRRIRLNYKGKWEVSGIGGAQSHFVPDDLIFTIGWILQGGQFGIEPGFCVFQLEEPTTPPPADSNG